MKNPILLVIGLALGGAFAWGAARTIRRGLARRSAARDQAARWRRVEGRVVSAVPLAVTSSAYNAATHATTTSTTYYPNVTFAYEVGGVERAAAQLHWEHAGGDAGKVARAIAERLPAGTAIPVFYDPDDPTRCALRLTRGGIGEVVLGALIALIAAFFLAMAILGNVG